MYDLDARITPAQAARLLDLSRQLIKDWYDRGRLKRGEDGLVRLGDVLKIEAETRNNRRRGTFGRGGTRNLQLVAV